MSSLPISPSQLAPFISNPHLLAIIEGAGRRYAEHIYASSLEEIPSTASDGMTRHSEFNRGLAEGFKRRARRGGWNWKTKHDASIPFLGDLVCLQKHRGQVRFGLQIGTLKFSLLHMTGKVDIHQRKVEVMELGPSRQNYLQQQNTGVVRIEPAHLFGGEGREEFALRLQDEEPLHILLVTQRRGMNLVQVYAALPIDRWEEEGIIPLAELEHLFDVPIQKTEAAPTVKPKAAPSELEITVSRKSLL